MNDKAQLQEHLRRLDPEEVRRLPQVFAVLESDDLRYIEKIDRRLLPVRRDDETL